jgi:hypothetical protein
MHLQLREHITQVLGSDVLAAINSTQYVYLRYFCRLPPVQSQLNRRPQAACPLEFIPDGHHESYRLETGTSVSVLYQKKQRSLSARYILLNNIIFCKIISY